jgi:hypothetical protein
LNKKEIEKMKGGNEMRKWLLVLLAAVFMGSFFIQSAMAGTLCANKFGQVKYFQGSCPTGILGWIEISVTGPKGDKGDPGIQGEQGIQGVKGDKGDQGIQGTNGLNGVSGYEIVEGHTAGDSNPHKTLVIECPYGQKPDGSWVQKKALSGNEGWRTQVPITYSYLSPTADVPRGYTWIFETYLDVDDYPVGHTWAIYGYVICAFVD